MRFIFKYLLPLVISISLAAGYFVYNQFTAFKGSQTAQNVPSFEIKKGSSIHSIAKNLQQKKIISSAQYFRFLAKITKQDKSIKAGEYRIDKGLTPAEILDLFTKGRTIQYQTRIPEGITFKGLVKIVKADKNLIQTLSDEDFKNIMQKLKTKYKHYKPEGWFFPDTYSYPKNTTDLQFLQRSHDAMKRILNNLWDKNKPYKYLTSEYDLLILASIIEKETGAPADRGKVARVFLNRLRKNMLLQTDPTVIYGMGESYKGNIRKKDLKKDTPYNTYTRKGLPPTPISIPSAASLESVLKPAAGDMLYFVAKGDGTSYFSKTYTEHKKAVIKYLLNGKASRYKGN